MKKVLGYLLVIVLLGSVSIAVTGSMQPSEFRVERSVNISAPTTAVFSTVADLKDWPKWSPWAKRDPNMKVKISDPSIGVGAYTTWNSETEGTGKQTVTKFVPNQSVVIFLEFYKPFEGTAMADFTLEKVSDNETKLTWGMDGKNRNLIEKIFYAFMSFDKMIGTDYETGLQSIKMIAEQ